jgi:hypothetical protein
MTAALLLDRPEGYKHVVNDIPEIAAAAFLKIFRQVAKRLPYIIANPLDSEVRLDVIVRRLFKILEQIFGHEANMRRIAKGSSRCVVGYRDTNLCPRAANAVHLFHERNEPADVLQDMAEMNEIHRVTPKWELAFKVADNIHSPSRTAVQANGARNLIRATAKINRDGLHNTFWQVSRKYSARRSHVWYLLRWV